MTSHPARVDFTEALEPVRSVLLARGFREGPPNINGFATWTLFRSKEADVEFSYGPPDYHVEIFIRGRGADARMYELSDLMAIPAIEKWIRANVLAVSNEEPVMAECRWFARLLEVALPHIAP